MGDRDEDELGELADVLYEDLEFCSSRRIQSPQKEQQQQQPSVDSLDTTSYLQRRRPSATSQKAPGSVRFEESPTTFGKEQQPEESMPEGGEQDEELEYMQPYEKSALLREQNMRRRYEQRLREWEHVEQHLCKTLQRNPDEMVAKRSENYRQLLEEKDLLEKAKPKDDNPSTEGWEMSLRGGDTRYVRVGNEFSGIYVPIKESGKPMRETIRHPLNRSKISGSTAKLAESMEFDSLDDPLSGLTSTGAEGEKTEETASKRRRKKHKIRTWWDDPVYQQRKQQLASRMEKLKPYRPSDGDMGELIAIGVPLFQWAQKYSNAHEEEFQPSRITDEKPADVGETSWASETRPSTEGSMSPLNKFSPSLVVEVQEDATTPRGIQGASTGPNGPELGDFSQQLQDSTGIATGAVELARGWPRVVLKCQSGGSLLDERKKARLGSTNMTLAQASIRLVNPNDCAIYFSWKRIDPGGPGAIREGQSAGSSRHSSRGGRSSMFGVGDEEFSGTDSSEIVPSRFTCGQIRGSLLPRTSEELTFYFRSYDSGTFRETWALETSPPVNYGNQIRIALRGIAVGEDKTLPQREDLSQRLSDRAAERVAQEVLESVLHQIQPEPTPPTEEEIRERQRKTFTKFNPGMAYSPSLYDEFQELQQEINDMGSTKQEEWDGSISTLLLQIDNIDSSNDGAVEKAKKHVSEQQPEQNEGSNEAKKKATTTKPKSKGKNQPVAAEEEDEDQIFEKAVQKKIRMFRAYAKSRMGILITQSRDSFKEERKDLYSHARSLVVQLAESIPVLAGAYRQNKELPIRDFDISPALGNLESDAAVLAVEGKYGLWKRHHDAKMARLREEVRQRRKWRKAKRRVRARVGLPRGQQESGGNEESDEEEIESPSESEYDSDEATNRFSDVHVCLASGVCASSGFSVDEEHQARSWAQHQNKVEAQYLEDYESGDYNISGEDISYQKESTVAHMGLDFPAQHAVNSLYRNKESSTAIVSYAHWENNLISEQGDVALSRALPSGISSVERGLRNARFAFTAASRPERYLGGSHDDKSSKGKRPPSKAKTSSSSKTKKVDDKPGQSSPKEDQEKDTNVHEYEEGFLSIVRKYAGEMVGSFATQARHLEAMPSPTPADMTDHIRKQLRLPSTHVESVYDTSSFHTAKKLSLADVLKDREGIKGKVVLVRADLDFSREVFAEQEKAYRKLRGQNAKHQVDSSNLPSEESIISKSPKLLMILDTLATLRRYKPSAVILTSTSGNTRLPFPTDIVEHGRFLGNEEYLPECEMSEPYGFGAIPGVEKELPKGEKDHFGTWFGRTPTFAPLVSVFRNLGLSDTIFVNEHVSQEKMLGGWKSQINEESNKIGKMSERIQKALDTDAKAPVVVVENLLRLGFIAELCNLDVPLVNLQHGDLSCSTGIPFCDQTPILEWSPVHTTLWLFSLCPGISAKDRWTSYCRAVCRESTDGKTLMNLCGSTFAEKVDHVSISRYFRRLGIAEADLGCIVNAVAYLSIRAKEEEYIQGVKFKLQGTLNLQQLWSRISNHTASFRSALSSVADVVVVDSVNVTQNSLSSVVGVRPRRTIAEDTFGIKDISSKVSTQHKALPAIPNLCVSAKRTGKVVASFGASVCYNLLRLICAHGRSLFLRPFSELPKEEPNIFIGGTSGEHGASFSSDWKNMETRKSTDPDYSVGAPSFAKSIWDKLSSNDLEHVSAPQPVVCVLGGGNNATSLLAKAYQSLHAVQWADRIILGGLIGAAYVEHVRGIRMGLTRLVCGERVWYSVGIILRRMNYAADCRGVRIHAPLDFLTGKKRASEVCQLRLLEELESEEEDEEEEEDSDNVSVDSEIERKAWKKRVKSELTCTGEELPPVEGEDDLEEFQRSLPLTSSPLRATGTDAEAGGVDDAGNFLYAELPYNPESYLGLTNLCCSFSNFTIQTVYRMERRKAPLRFGPEVAAKPEYITVYVPERVHCNLGQEFEYGSEVKERQGIPDSKSFAAFATLAQAGVGQSPGCLSGQTANTVMALSDAFRSIETASEGVNTLNDGQARYQAYSLLRYFREFVICRLMSSDSVPGSGDDWGEVVTAFENEFLGLMECGAEASQGWMAVKEGVSKADDSLRALASLTAEDQALLRKALGNFEATSEKKSPRSRKSPRAKESPRDTASSAADTGPSDPFSLIPDDEFVLDIGTKTKEM